MARRPREFPFDGHIFRSEYERKQARRLVAEGIHYEYESKVLEYLSALPRASCLDCGSGDVGVVRSYTPDFFFPNANLFVETKGRFDSKTRTKMKEVCRQSSDDIRMVFMSNNWLTKKHKMNYGRWCDINHIEWAVGDIPLEWIE